MKEAGLPLLPGTSSVSEVLAAVEAGLSTLRVAAGGQVLTYGFGPDAHYRAVDVEPGPTGCAFTYVEGGVEQTGPFTLDIGFLVLALYFLFR